jgi:hypothetical protein
MFEFEIQILTVRILAGMIATKKLPHPSAFPMATATGPN